MDNSTRNILVAGVGGQGVILASDIMCDVFMEAGYDVKKSEIHGMAMRGGIVTSHFRFGTKVYSPLIKEGEVDILFAFEQLEGLRWLNHLRPNGKIIMNDHRINPPAVTARDMAMYIMVLLAFFTRGSRITGRPLETASSPV